MNQEHHQRVLDVFAAVFEQATEQRSRLLDQHCADDAELRAEVEEMLRLHDQSGVFLETPALGAGFQVSGDAMLEEPGHGLVGQVIGDFTLCAVIASGGMGTVYEARQEHPQRTVAVKVLRRGLVTRSALRRFEFEAQVLARLQHPNIAQIIEAGTWQEEGSGEPGLPYFVMEFIPGARPITRYVREERLSVSARLDLFIQVCRAVHHGHQKGVVHRDLKPDNILVDDQGRPKVIDFGVARVSDTEVAVTTMHTAVDQILGTLQYMSPEQCDADPQDIDTRSDVYSLGVLLHEMLCDQLPYDVSRLAVHQALEVIRSQEPVRDGDTQRVLKGDLDTITGKALQKERDHRYASVADLGDDLQRFLDHEPIAARPPSAMYQLRKFARRNRALVGGAVAVVLALVLGLAGTSWQARAAGKARGDEEVARKAAERETAVKTAALDFMKEMLSGFKAGESDMSVLELVNRASESIDSAFPDQPLVEADVQDLLRHVYAHMELLDQALRHAQRSKDLVLGALGPQAPLTLDRMNEVLWLLEDDEEAVALARLVWEARRDSLGPDDLETLRSERALARELRETGEVDEAEARLLRVLAVLQGLPDAAFDVAEARWNLASVSGAREDWEGQVSWLRQAIEATRSLHPPVPAMLGHQLYDLGDAHRKLDQRVEAQACLDESLRIGVEEEGPAHPSTLSRLRALGDVLRNQDRFAEAASLYEGFLEESRERLLDQHAELGQVLHHQAEILVEWERWGEAKPIAMEAVQWYRQADDFPAGELHHAAVVAYLILQEEGDLAARIAMLELVEEGMLHAGHAEHPQRAYTLELLGLDLVEAEQWDRAVEVLFDLVDLIEEVPEALAGAPWKRLSLRSFLGEALMEQGLFEEAEAHLVSAAEEFHESDGPAAVRRVVRNRVVRLYEAMGLPQDAAKWRDG